jgi:hypothetical protein
MDADPKSETSDVLPDAQSENVVTSAPKGRRRGKKDSGDDGLKKRRCISSACVPCRKRKSKVRLFVILAGPWRLRLSLS